MIRSGCSASVKRLGSRGMTLLNVLAPISFSKESIATRCTSSEPGRLFEVGPSLFEDFPISVFLTLEDKEIRTLCRNCSSILHRSYGVFIGSAVIGQIVRAIGIDAMERDVRIICCKQLAEVFADHPQPNPPQTNRRQENWFWRIERHHGIKLLGTPIAGPFRRKRIRERRGSVGARRRTP